ncbi:GntR family transcriptional regulator [Leucobacter sp. wl10]|uniref:GntR family transcriptional regulator n=1 Tax=Leucobacter sp. wl10 TaxID=2304677 RepID=UPI000E5B32D9|nr:GntR family transcriptional regulator [Leucobacter sp. wl10]RGE24376.1 GntR family transcriptional regulator [Leucobacter sp. wl10]
MKPTTEESKADRAYRELKHRLILLDIAPGDAINEVALSSELGLGRTPIREALKRLESDRLVAFYPRRGTFATGVDITDLAEISEMREVLEPLAARKAAAAALDPELRLEFEAVVRELEGVGSGADQRRMLEHDLRVHRLVYRAVGNHHLAATLTRLDDLATRIWGLVRDRIPDISAHVGEHVELLRAILDGDADRAAALSEAHVRHFEDTVRSVL